MERTLAWNIKFFSWSILSHLCLFNSGMLSHLTPGLASVTHVRPFGAPKPLHHSDCFRVGPVNPESVQEALGETFSLLYWTEHGGRWAWSCWSHRTEPENGVSTVEGRVQRWRNFHSNAFTWVTDSNATWSQSSSYETCTGGCCQGQTYTHQQGSN